MPIMRFSNSGCIKYEFFRQSTNLFYQMPSLYQTATSSTLNHKMSHNAVHLYGTVIIRELMTFC